MHDPFIRPQDSSAQEAVDAIMEELGLFDDWPQRYQYIIELGRKTASFPSEWRTDSRRVPGCQSQVWLETSLQDGRIFFSGTSDAAIVAGLVALLLRIYSGRTAAEILAIDPAFLQKLGLLEALSTSRGNGTAAMVRAIRSCAEQVLAAGG